MLRPRGEAEPKKIIKNMNEKMERAKQATTNPGLDDLYFNSK